MASTAAQFQIMNALADACVTPMSPESSRAFLEGYREIHRKYSTRGPMKAALKRMDARVYDVNGKGFNKLWEHVKKYVECAVDRRFGSTFPEEREDDMMEIRLRLFTTLRFFGSKPNGYLFSHVFPVVVRQVLTSLTGSRFITEKNQVNRLKHGGAQASAHYRYANCCDEVDPQAQSHERLFPADNSQAEDLPLLLSIPEEFSATVDLIFGNEFVSVACKETGVTIQRFRQVMGAIVEDRA